MTNPFDKYLSDEHILQIQICTYVKFQFKSAKIHHSMNEGKRTAFERYLSRKLGMSVGFPDLLIVYKGQIIFLELKTGKGKLSDEQKDWLMTLPTATVAYDFETAKKFIDEHFLKLR